MRMHSKRMAMLSILTAFALIIFVIESLFPPLFIPGAKLGLSNVVTLLTLCLLGPGDALLLTLLRTVLGALVTGGISTLMYSLPAGVASVLLSALLMRRAFPRISLVAVSVAASVLHNLTQNLIYCLISQTPQMLGYAPYLAMVGAAAGLVTGYAAFLVIRTIPLSVFRRALAG